MVGDEPVAFERAQPYACAQSLQARQRGAIGQGIQGVARNVQVIGCSTDSEFSHVAWLNTEHSDGGIKGVTYPLVADINKTIAADYGVLAGETDYDDEGKMVVNGELVAYRGLFLIDKQGIVHHAVINNFPLGRSTVEELRMVDALQHVEKYGEVCPMNWEKGKEAVKADHESISNYISKL